MVRIFLLTLLLKMEGAEFELRQGTIIDEGFDYIRVVFKTKSNNNNPVLYWKKYSGTPYNFMVSYPDRVVMMLNTDNQNVIDEASKTLADFVDKKYGVTEEIERLKKIEEEKVKNAN